MKNPHEQAYHLSHEEIASFAEGTTGEIDSLRVRAHLQGCDFCLDSYRFVVRFSGAHDDSPSGDMPGSDALQAAREIARHDAVRGHQDRRGKRGWAGRLNPAGQALMASAIVAVFIAAAVWFRPLPGGEGFDPNAEGLAPVTRAMAVASGRGQMVLPGVEGLLEAAPVVVRSGSAPITRELDNALARLAVAYNDGSLASDEAQWLIGGYLASGQKENARVYIEDACRRYPGDLDLLVLDGVLSYGDDDLDRASARFEAVLAEDGKHAVAAFNLAVVRAGQDDPAGARLLYERVRDEASGSPLAERAESALSDLP